MGVRGRLSQAGRLWGPGALGTWGSEGQVLRFEPTRWEGGERAEGCGEEGGALGSGLPRGGQRALEGEDGQARAPGKVQSSRPQALTSSEHSLAGRPNSRCPTSLFPTD